VPEHRRAAHGIQRRVGIVVGDHEHRAAVLHECIDLVDGRVARVGDSHRSTVDRPEHDGQPLGAPAREHDDALAGARTGGAEQPGPPCRAAGDLGERAPLDDAHRVDERPGRRRAARHQPREEVARDVRALGCRPDVGAPLQLHDPEFAHRSR
jgi:hypothetical protein